MINAVPTAYDFKIDPNLIIHPTDPNDRSREVPLRVTGRITNLASFGNEVNCRLYIDANSATDPITIPLEAGQSKDVTFALDWLPPNFPTDKVKITQGIFGTTSFYSTTHDMVTPIVGDHDFTIELESIEKGTAVESLFDSNPNNNTSTGSANIAEDFNCSVDSIFFARLPAVVNKRTGLGANLTNTSLVTASFNVRVIDSYIDRATGSQVNDTVVDETVEDIEPFWEFSAREPNWVPPQSGTHTIIVECEDPNGTIVGNYEVDIVVEPQLIELETGPIFDQANSNGTYVLREETLGGETQRVLLFTKATANPFDESAGILAQSRIAGGMYKTFVLEDGSTTSGLWDIDLTLEGTFVGIIDSMSYGVVPNLFSSSYFLSIQVGVVSDNGPDSYNTPGLDECPEDHTTPRDLYGGCAHYLPIYYSHPLDEIIETFAWPVAEEIVGKVASRTANLLYLLEKAIDYQSCKEIIIGEGSFNMGRMRVQNGVPFTVFIRMYGAVEAFAPDFLTETYISFSDQEEDGVPCDESFSVFEGTSYPLRGLSIENVTITINAAPE